MVPDMVAFSRMLFEYQQFQADQEQSLLLALHSFHEIYPVAMNPPMLPSQQPLSVAQAPRTICKKPKRKQVKNACVHCQKACKRCDDGRACKRCIKLGLEATCVDSPRKPRLKGTKRGPYKKRQEYQNICDAGLEEPQYQPMVLMLKPENETNITAVQDQQTYLSFLLSDEYYYQQMCHGPSSTASTPSTSDLLLVAEEQKYDILMATDSTCHLFPLAQSYSITADAISYRHCEKVKRSENGTVICNPCPS